MSIGIGGSVPPSDDYHIERLPEIQDAIARAFSRIGAEYDPTEIGCWNVAPTERPAVRLFSINYASRDKSLFLPQTWDVNVDDFVVRVGIEPYTLDEDDEDDLRDLLDGLA